MTTKEEVGRNEVMTPTDTTRNQHPRQQHGWQLSFRACRGRGPMCSRDVERKAASTSNQPRKRGDAFIERTGASRIQIDEKRAGDLEDSVDELLIKDRRWKGTGANETHSSSGRATSKTRIYKSRTGGTITEKCFEFPPHFRDRNSWDTVRGDPFERKAQAQRDRTM